MDFTLIDIHLNLGDASHELGDHLSVLGGPLLGSLLGSLLRGRLHIVGDLLERVDNVVGAKILKLIHDALLVVALTV